MQIVSKYQKILSFPDINLTMNPNQVITVEDKLGKELIKDPWIVEMKDGSSPPTFGHCGCIFGEEKPIEKKAEPIQEKVESVHAQIKNVEIEEKKIEKEIPKKNKITIEEKKRSNQDKTIKD